MKAIARHIGLGGYRAVRPLLPSSTRAYPTRAGRVYLDVSESPMMLRRVLRRYEVDKHRLLGRILRPGDVFVDVGSNRGDFTVLAGRLVGPTGRVLAIEPAPSNLPWLRRSVTANGLDGVVDLLDVAVSDRDGRANLLVSNRSGAHSLVTGQDASGVEVEVVTRTLDRLLAEHGLPAPRAVKVDVEGADLLVLGGMSDLLAGEGPLVLLLDLHPHLGADVREVGRMLGEAGFSLRDPRRPATEVALDGDEREVVAVKGHVTGLAD